MLNFLSHTVLMLVGISWPGYGVFLSHLVPSAFGSDQRLSEIIRDYHFDDGLSDG